MHYDTLWYIMIHFDTLWCIMMHYDTFWYILIHFDTLWYILIHFDTLWYILIHYDTLWYIMIHYDTLWYIMMHYDTLWYINASNNLGGSDLHPLFSIFFWSSVLTNPFRIHLSSNSFASIGWSLRSSVYTNSEPWEMSCVLPGRFKWRLNMLYPLVN